MTGMANKPKPRESGSSGLTKPGDLYISGDALPLPEVVEKDSDSVWALWSDTIEEVSQEPDAQKDGEPDFVETVPMDFDSMGPTQIMDLPDDLEEDPKKR